MPLFDFACRSCGHGFEALVRAGHAAACPHCGSGDLERLPSTPTMKTADRSRAAADANIRKHSILGHKETMLREEEAKKHRHEDH